jgi:two-component system LytT family sensor kinase
MVLKALLPVTFFAPLTQSIPFCVRKTRISLQFFTFTSMKKNTLYWICQIGGWFLFVMLEFIGYGNIYGFNNLLILNVVINFFAGIILTHFYRLFIIRRSWINLPMKSLVPRAILGVGAISFILTLLNVYLDRLTVPLMNELPVDPILIFNYLFNWSKYILLWALVYHLFQYWERSLEAEKARYQLQAIIKENQYQNLKTQLNPHFLFNSLNSIRTLVDVNPDLSKEAITKLSSLLRSSLQMSREKTVTLKQELQTVADYLAIEKIRFDDRLQTTLHIKAETLTAKLPPMMLQTLVENAVKHGISKAKFGGQIEISAMLTQFHLHLEIINTGQYTPSKNDHGVGLENTRERLSILYDSNAAFSIENLNEQQVITKIDIPL